MVKDNPSSFLSFSKTATNDNPFRLTEEKIPFFECNFHVLTNDAYYGDGAVQEAEHLANNVSFFKKADLSDIWFRNKTGAANCKVVAVATVPTTFVLQALGLI